MNVQTGLTCLVIIAVASATVAAQGPIVVWGTSTPELLNAPTGNFIAATGGGDYGAAIRVDGTLAVWGDTIPAMFNVPTGTFLSLDGGTRICAAIRANGTIAAWGEAIFGLTNPPSGTFSKVSVSERHAAALRTDGTLTTWGASLSSPPPSGQFLDVAAGKESFCIALRADGTLAAWGFDIGGVLNVPGGQFVAVGAGEASACALRADGSMAFWGAVPGNPALLTGDIRSIASSYYNTVGLRADGTLTWDTPNPLPGGTYSSIGAGNTFRLAIIPMPSTSAALVLAFLGALRRRR